MKSENRARYRYSAAGEQELDTLRQRFAADDAADLEALRDLDRRATRRASIKAVAIGAAGLLVFGAGLSMVLSYRWFIPGSVVGCVGIGVMAAMPALYEVILRRERREAIQSKETH